MKKMKKGIEMKIWEVESVNKNLGGEKEKKMKTKNKMIAMVDIAIVLFSVFLVATLPAIAAEQITSASKVTAASEDDYVLGVYGNANEDDTIDMRDLTYVKLIFFGKKPETELADAKYDGKINPLDFIQIKLIIVGKEKEITFVDELERGDAPPEVVTIHKPVERIIISSMLDQAEALRSLGAKDKVIGVGETIKDSPVWLPELSKLPYVPQTHTTIDYEAVLTLNPEVLWAIGRSRIDREKLPGVAVIHLRLTSPITFAEGVRKLGYILDKREEAEKLCNWHEGYINKIESRTGGLSEDEKPKVFLWGGYISGGGYQTCNSGRMHEMCDIAGGKNIAEDLELPGRGGPWLKVDSEWVIVQNPDIIVALAQSGCGYSIDDPSEMAALRDDILMNRPELAKITAVKSGSVYMMTFQDFAVGGAGGLLGIAHQAKWFHPDLFVDVDPEAIHQEYVTRFQHLDYDLDKHGVFVYPLSAS